MPSHHQELELQRTTHHRDPGFGACRAFQGCEFRFELVFGINTGYHSWSLLVITHSQVQVADFDVYAGNADPKSSIRIERMFARCDLGSKMNSDATGPFVIGRLKTIALIPGNASLGGGLRDRVGSASGFTAGESDDR